jgi:hypothetical protein
MRTVTIDGVKKTFHEAHQDLWNYLAENPGKTKEDYFITHDSSIYPENECFACESCACECERCPITQWKNDSETLKYDILCYGREDEYGEIIIGLYGKWGNLIREKRFTEACEIAKEIANLEWPEGEE